MSRFERDELELGWWVAMHRAVEDGWIPLQTPAWLAQWWRTF